MRRRPADEAPRRVPSGQARLTPRAGALAGIALSSLAWLVLVFAGFGGEWSACPGSPSALVQALGVVCPVVATAGLLLAVWAYRASAGPRSAEWLLGAAGLYVTVIGWAGAVTGGGALLLVDLCASA